MAGSNLKENIVLVGFMGSGKTEVGQTLAQHLKVPFLDIDQEIEHKAGLSVNEIFAQKGEQFFRQLELEAVMQAFTNDRQVVALGGGAFVNEGIRNYCLGNAVVVFLNPTWATIRSRLEQLRPTRPLLQQKSEAETRELFYFRQQFYRLAHLEIQTDPIPSIKEVAARIAELLNE